MPEALPLFVLLAVMFGAVPFLEVTSRRDARRLKAKRAAADRVARVAARARREGRGRGLSLATLNPALAAALAA